MVAITAAAGCAAATRDPGSAAAVRPAPCVLPVADSQWLSGALRAWEYTRERLLVLPPDRLPILILFDSRCSYTVSPPGPFPVAGREHHGSIELPNGTSMPPSGVAITSPTERDTAIFVAMALPEAWRADPRYGEFDNSRVSWNRYLTGAFIHEMTHARMLRWYLPRLRALEVAVYPDTLEDNAVQNRFASDDAFAASVAHETELLYDMLTATSRKTRTDLARSAIERIRARRQQSFVGDLELWAELEQTFLDLEGVAQWAAFKYRLNTSDRAAPVMDVLRRFRSGREFWSEELGLALILALDALVPGWQARMFSADAMTSLDLLAQALADRS